MLRASLRNAALLASVVSLVFSVTTSPFASAASAPELDVKIRELRTQALSVKALANQRIELEAELATLEAEEAARLAALPPLVALGLPSRGLTTPDTASMPQRTVDDVSTQLQGQTLTLPSRTEVVASTEPVEQITPDGLAVIPSARPDNEPETVLPEVTPGTSYSEPTLDEGTSLSGVPMRPLVQESVGPEALAVSPTGQPLRDAADAVILEDAFALPSRNLDAAAAPRTLADVRSYVLQARSTEYHALVSLLLAVRDVSGATFDVLKVADEWRALPAARLNVMLDGLQLLGTPYVFATSGPEAFDCSGFTLTLWGSQGVTLQHWAASQQMDLEARDAQSALAADLVFFSGGPTAGGPLNIGHVALVLTEGVMLQASPANGVWVNNFDLERAVAYASPLTAVTSAPATLSE